MTFDPEPADVAVIGAGVVGLAVAYRLSKEGSRVVVIEKESKAGMGVTAGQANVIHVVQLPFGSVKSRLARRGNRMYDELCAELGVTLNRMPALLVVTGWSKAPVLLAAYFYLKTKLRGEFGVRLMRGRSLRREEPELATKVIAGVVVEGYGTLDTTALVSKLQSESERLGAKFMFNTQFRGARPKGNATRIETSEGTIETTAVVNAAGLQSDDVARNLGYDLGQVEPGLGVMAVYTGLHLGCVVAPLPLSLGSRTKGGAIIPATDGTTIVGPTLRIASSKDDRLHTEADLEALRKKFGPLLKNEGTMVRVYTGVRPLSPSRDFVISFDSKRTILNLVGIESPGLTAAPAIAEEVASLLNGAKK